MERQNAYSLNFFRKIYRFIKAIADFVIALLALIVLSPLLIIVAVAIKIDSPGPVFFAQKRIGKDGKHFNCIKFRSMSVEARHDVAGYEYDGMNTHITKVGRVIRKLSIDELPQLFNVLIFQMSLIGYRPSQPCEKELNDARERYGMYQIRPGISGWAQINGRDILAANPKKKAEFDRYYLLHMSPWLDIKILFLTVGKVVQKDDVVDGPVESSVETADNASLFTTSTSNDIRESRVK